MFSKIIRLYHTVKHLKNQQIIFRGIKTIKHFLPHPKIQNRCPQTRQLKIINSIFSYEEFKDKKSFSFLNKFKQYEKRINWNDLENGKLWNYHLCSFNYLGQKNLNKEIGISLIKSFISHKKIKDGLEPYPISLRLINTIKFLQKHKIEDHQINNSLWWQTKILRNNIEYHLMGNHLLENGFALLYGGAHFNDTQLVDLAETIITNQLVEQVLPDGAHFELSPMYHSIILFRLLDSYNLLINNLPDRAKLKDLVEKKASEMLGWLKSFSYIDGTYPHFNDSTNGIAPLPNQLFEYANRLKVETKEKPLKESGYRKVDEESYQLRIDMGQIGPDYLPGHSHNDIFSFELKINNLPFIVDTGISTYQIGNTRQKERSTNAHNTVQIQTEEQTEMWSSFRVGRRGYPIITNEKKREIEGQYNYPTKKYTHTRKFNWSEELIDIHDELNTNKNSKAYLHFHPSIHLQIEGNTIRTKLANITVQDAQSINIEKYNFASGFNKTISSNRAVIKFNREIKTTIRI